MGIAKLPITLACHGYDRVQALKDGSVQPEGVDLRFIDLPVEEIFYRQSNFLEFDASEIGMSQLVLRDPQSLPFVAVPAFVSRMFRHSCVFVDPDRGISRPEDLRGKRVGVPEYPMAAAIWVRGFLADDFGVHPEELEWFTGGLETPGRVAKVAVTLPPDIHVEALPLDQTLNDWLDDGRLDAYIGPRAPRNPRLRRLFPDFETAESDYYRRTGVYPIMHCVAIRRELYEREPWLAQSLFKAFVAAKAQALRDLSNTSSLQSMLPWSHGMLERAQQVFGTDIYPYGVEASRGTLETMIRYCREQHLTGHECEIDRMFAANTYGEYKI